jgi:hypothetical protein
MEQTSIINATLQKSYTKVIEIKSFDQLEGMSFDKKNYKIFVLVQHTTY